MQSLGVVLFSALVLNCEAYKTSATPKQHIDQLKLNMTMKVVQFLYQGLQTPHTFQEDRDKYVGAAVTYGEILPESVMEISSSFEAVNRTGLEFWDLGSGGGKMVLQEFLLNGWRRSVGVELVTRRYNIAVEALKMLEKHYNTDSPIGDFLREHFGENCDMIQTGTEGSEQRTCFGNADRELCYINGDMTKVRGMERAGGVFMCSTCFSDELLLNMMDNQFKKMKSGSMILSLRKLPEINDALAKDDLELVSETTHDMSWAKDDYVRVYKKLDDHSVTQEHLHTYHL